MGSITTIVSAKIARMSTADSHSHLRYSVEVFHPVTSAPIAPTSVASEIVNAAIANRLYLSPKTVRNMVSSIFSKLQVADRAEAIVRAREAGLGIG